MDLPKNEIFNLFWPFDSTKWTKKQSKLFPKLEAHRQEQTRGDKQMLRILSLKDEKMQAGEVR